ncbi:MAG: glutamate 5-kinase [Planctomycetes bacterium]|nr:glutamate 5-kinase [Planctomycetota bacterium]
MDPSHRHAVIEAATLIVVKVGTRVLTTSAGLLDDRRIEALCRQFDTLLAAGREIVLVSSGAVGAGMGRLGLASRPQELAHLQAVAAIGQSCLVEAYERALRSRGRHAAQVLLVADDLRQRTRYLNIRNTLRALVDYGAVPIINENDTVSVEELRSSFGDNDRLAAQVATLVGAPLLVLLSDVDGLFDRHPAEPGARLLPEITAVDAAVEGLARDRLGGVSKGGMASKIAAARIVTEAGGHCLIASGRDDHVLERIIRGEPVGTMFLGRPTTMPARKRWLGWSADARGVLLVDDGARRALADHGRSLLAAGVVEVEGEFAVGDIVAVAGSDRRPFARGLVNYPADELRRIAGLKTEAIASVLGYCPYDEVVHRDNLAVINREAATI